MTEQKRTVSTEELREEMIRLGPWHLDVEITPELSTKDYLDGLDSTPGAASVLPFTLESPKKGVSQRLSRIFPNGLEGRSVLDCACNCGAYLFWAKELGAGECFGFDVREHWIEQARFLARHREGPGSDIRFEVHDLYDLPKLGLERFDITLFRGIFYHLPDPITGLKIAADLTSELLIVNTASMSGLPDGLLAVSGESRTDPTSGVYGLNWFPTGPQVIARILNWAGFPETRRMVWWTPPGQPESLDRLEVLASRSEGYFGPFDIGRPEGDDGIREIVSTNVPPRSIVLFATGTRREPLDVRSRQVWRFPREEAFEGAGEFPGDGRAIEHLEQLRSEGAQYLVFGGSALTWLEHDSEFALHAGNRYPAIVRNETCVIFDLQPDEPTQPAAS